MADDVRLLFIARQNSSISWKQCYKNAEQEAASFAGKRREAAHDLAAFIMNVWQQVTKGLLEKEQKHPALFAEK